MKTICLTLAIMISAGVTTTSAQFKKLLQKATQTAEGALEKKPASKSQTGGSTPGGNTTGSPSNTGGAGLISTPPDVKQNLDDADKAYQSKSYGDARYSVQQAMLGVELEIGNQILKSLPSSVSGLNKVEAEDQVASSGFGWAGLVISRRYNDAKEKEFKV